MKTFTVYHATEPTFGLSPLAPANFPEEFDNVAAVECDTLEQVFEMTNHITEDWRGNPGVKATTLAKRSTSIGDVVVSDGVRYLCSATTWKTF